MRALDYYEAPLAEKFRPDTAASTEEDKDGSLAWIGLVLMGFSSMATLGLLGWFVTALFS
jgi:hypothetical protein